MMLEDDELLDLNAQLLLKTHTSLRKAGFTDEQATAIIAGQGTGMKMG